MSRFRRKRRYTKKNLSVAKKALRKVNKLARDVRPALKIHDFDLLTLTPAVAGIVTHLNVIAQGVAKEQRIGLQCKGVFMSLRYSIQNDTSAPASITRLLLIQDLRQEDATAPLLLEVLLSANVMSPRSRVNPKRFKIYFDKTYNLTTTGKLVHTKVFNKKINVKMSWLAAAGNTQNKNGIYLISMSDLAANLPTLNFTWRLWFTDV